MMRSIKKIKAEEIKIGIIMIENVNLSINTYIRYLKELIQKIRQKD